ncbi:hypothetical protein RclHR1_01820010 [Rhizophagus clarus]|uniref:Uncharacterized protein n=1 Tax=Rhizophagus clarus TaxID=94130 RepID=A0A2Z6R299_9GLOM|nr:hypothetical protein RclHR1_01820010 [Rhizophagus clarus]
MSTQILTKKVNLENNPSKHISIKEKVSQDYPDTNVHAISVDYDETPSKNHSVLEQTMTSHGLAAAILHAYNHHQHLRLTPDDIWLTIAQGISIYAGDILHTKGSRLEGDWPEVVNRLVVKTDQAVEKIDIKPLLECNFSTTTKNSLTASRIVLLDMVKAYFEFK